MRIGSGSPSWRGVGEKNSVTVLSGLVSSWLSTSSVGWNTPIALLIVGSTDRSASETMTFESPPAVDTKVTLSRAYSGRLPRGAGYKVIEPERLNDPLAATADTVGGAVICARPPVALQIGLVSASEPLLSRTSAPIESRLAADAS